MPELRLHRDVYHNELPEFGNKDHAPSEVNAMKKIRLSVIIPCYNEEKTLFQCVRRVLDIAGDRLELDVIIVDDGSIDGSLEVAAALAEQNIGAVKVLKHRENRGKGASLQTGFSQATGDYVAVQDADLEYDPKELLRLLVPLIENRADVVIGSRFLSFGAHRVLYYWHSVGNKFLTMVSNMFTDLNLTDMESCYKVFRREVLQKVSIQENRFGFEPEIVAKIAHMGIRVYEMGISYHGRTYAEGKKIGAKDGLRALYCIFRYNAPQAPLPVQFLIYLFVGGAAAVVNLIAFLLLYYTGFSVTYAAAIAFGVAAAANYLFCILVVFRHQSRYSMPKEIIAYVLLVVALAWLDMRITNGMIEAGGLPAISKLIATGVGLILNFLARRYLVFAKPVGRKSW